MLRSFGYVGIFVLVALLFPIGALAAASIIRPKKPNPIKSLTYECGVDPVGEAWVQVNVRYYLYALLFVIFDVEAVFLYPWAVAYNKLGFYAFAEMIVFVLILLMGYIYAWKKKAMEWK
ncbi:MAG: NADH-quinone oxidoreductase subunit A [Chloroflexi bacterium]|nr:NADH-quinone oxidoreductase subunit A [Chloroflexota bacterium]